MIISNFQEQASTVQKFEMIKEALEAKIKESEEEIKRKDEEIKVALKKQASFLSFLSFFLISRASFSRTLL